VTQIAARVGGPIVRVAVADNQLVKVGDVLVEIDPRDYQVAVDKARAELAQSEAELALSFRKVRCCEYFTRTLVAFEDLRSYARKEIHHVRPSNDTGARFR